MKLVATDPGNCACVTEVCTRELLLTVVMANDGISILLGFTELELSIPKSSGMLS